MPPTVRGRPQPRLGRVWESTEISNRLGVARAWSCAGVLSAIYLISYSGAAVPGLVAGQLSRTLSLFDIALGYGALAALACVVTLVAAREPRAPALPAAHAAA